MPASTLRKTALALALAAVLGTLGCSESVESLVASGDAALAKGDYRTAEIQLKSALQKDGNNARARWLLGELSLAVDDGASAEKEIRRAGELGVGNDAVIPALAQALLLQGKIDEVLDLAQPPDLSTRSRGEVMAAQGLALLAKGDKGRANELTAEAMKLAPDSKFATTSRVRVLVDANKLDEAEQLLTGLQQKFPDYGLAWSLTGDVKGLRGDLPTAEEAYTTAITKRPIKGPDQLKRALVRLRQRNLDGALADAQQLNKAFPNLQVAWYVTGAVHFQKTDFPKAQEALDRSYQLNNDHLPTLILLGWSNLNLGNLGQAGAQARRAVAIAPNVVGARLLMATIDLREGRPQRAEDMTRPVVHAFPDNLPAKGLLIASLQAQGKGAEAAPLLEQVAAANPEALDLQTTVGIELMRAGQSDKAVGVLGRAAEHAPEAPRPTAALVAALLQQKRMSEALATAERFQEQNPKDIAALRLLAETQLASGDQAKAMATYRKALDLSPGDPPASVRLAEFLTRDNDFDGARKVLEGGLAKHPDDSGLMAVLSQVAVRQGKAEEAKSLLREAIEKDPAYLSARLLLAGQLLQENDAKGALAALPAAGGASDTRVLAARSQANLKLKNYEKARDDLEKLAAIQPQSASVQFELANVYGALGDVERMHNSLDQAVALDPKSGTIGAAQARSLAVRGKTAEAMAAITRLGLPETDPTRLSVEALVAQTKGDRAGQLRASEALFKVQPSAQSMLILVQAQAASGELDAAEGTLRGWVEQHADDEVAVLTLAQLLGRTDRAAEAVPLFRRLVEKHPDNAVLLNNLAWYLKDNDPKEALAVAKEAYAVASDNEAVIDTYSVVLTKNGELGAALRVLDRAMATAPKSTLLRLRRIEVLAQGGDREKALAEVETFLADGPPPALRAAIEAVGQRLESTGKHP